MAYNGAAQVVSLQNGHEQTELGIQKGILALDGVKPHVRRGSLAVPTMGMMHAAEASEAAAAERNLMFCLVAVGGMTITTQLFIRARKRYKMNWCSVSSPLQVTRLYRLRRHT